MLPDAPSFPRPPRSAHAGSVRRRHIGRFVSGLLLAAAIAAGLISPLRSQTLRQAASAEPTQTLLNSERIEQRFGSYGIEVLEFDGAVRVSNLYSREGEETICRTFAVVRLPTVIDPRVAGEHQAILEGQSIGAVFLRNGWALHKAHRYFGEISASPRLSRLMGGTGDSRLAVHIYALEVSRGDVAMEYATIAEVHHPDYLRLNDLLALYGKPDRSADRDLPVREMLRTVAEKMR